MFLFLIKCLLQDCLEIACASCGFKDTPDNSRIVNDVTYEIGSSIEFECSQGYDMTGNAKMICQANGEWSPSEPPTCKIKTCGVYKPISHATVFQEESRSGVRNSFGSIVHVKCDPGFILNGHLRIKCQADGTWEERPSCVKSNCPLYPGLNSSCIDKTWQLGVFLHLFCRDDISSKKTGPDAVECIDGEWESTYPLSACYCDCFVNADFEKVSINGRNGGYIGHTSKLTWSCKTGYIKNVTEPLVCDDGNIGTPICVPDETAPAVLPPAESPEWIAAVVVICMILVASFYVILYTFISKTTK